MITRYGYDVYLGIVLFCAVISGAVILTVDNDMLRYSVWGFSLLLVLFATNFFRDPNRTTPPTERGIISPADGKVIIVKEVEQPEYLNGRAVLISVFMSPLNVHVNRNPISGKVEHIRYLKGEYFAAFEDKASEKNEQSIIGVKNRFGKVLFKQIAGFLARRIVYELAVGDSVTAGERFGMIKFGSRVDVVFSPDAHVAVRIGDHVKGGSTILATLPVSSTKAVLAGRQQERSQS